MKIENYISDLLYRYNCVIVPDFGAFLTQQASAIHHDNTNSFYPPKKEVAFNAQLQNNDGLLANYIAEFENTPYQNAVSKIELEVTALKSKLLAGQTINLQNIGALTLNSESQIVFRPINSVNYLTDAFGLSHFSKAPYVAREAHKATVVALEASAPLALTLETRSKKTNWLKYAAVAVILLGLSSAISTGIYSNTIHNQNEIAVQNANAKLDAKVQEATFVISNPLPAVILSLDKAQTGNYHIVAGAFRIEANAERKVKQLKAKGFTGAKIVGQNATGLYVVIYGSFQTKEEAFRELRFIQQDHNPDAWVFVKKVD